MFKERLLDTLKKSQNSKDPDKDMSQTITKIEKHKRLSSQEFLKGYDAIWREGPKTPYQNPNAWRRPGDTL